MKEKKNYAAPFAIMSFLLFLLGFVTWINQILVPFMESKFDISTSQAQLVTSSFFGAYIISIPVGGLVRRLGYKVSVIIGSIITGIGCAIFIPALDVGYYMVLTALFVTALGIVLLQVVANPYVIALGSVETSASRLTFAMAINSAAAILAPVLGSSIIIQSGNQIEVNEQMAKLIYLVLAGVAILTGILLVFANLPAIEGDGEDEVSEGVLKIISKYPHIILGFLAIGMYMGLEVGIGNILVNYSSYNVNIDAGKAAKILGVLPFGMFVGRLLGAGILKKYEASKVLLANSLICVVLMIAFFVTKGRSISLWPMIAQGLFLSIMWSVLFDLSMKDVPANTAKLASGIICTGVVLTGPLTWLMGYTVESLGEGKDYGIAYYWFFLFYAFIIFFALKGEKIRKKSIIHR